MISTSPAFTAWLATNQQRASTCWYIVRKDDLVFTFTDSDGNITTPTALFPIGGGFTYLASAGYKASDITHGSELDVDTMEIQGMLRDPSITEDSLFAGLWDNAEINVFLVNRADLSMGPMYLLAGNLGKVTIDRGIFKADLMSLLQQFTRVIGDLATPTCLANLGDARCKVRLIPDVWAANTAYALASLYDGAIGGIIRPTVENRVYYRCTVAGVSGATEPVWNTVIGGTTSDGTVTWTGTYGLTITSTLTDVNPDTLTVYDDTLTEPGPSGGVSITGVTNANPGVVTFTGTLALSVGEAVTLSEIGGMPLLNAVTIVRNPATNSFELGIDTSNTAIYGTYTSGGLVTPLGVDSGFFDYGVIQMLDGANAGQSVEVKSYVPGQITLWVPFPDDNQPGDQYTMHAGCNKLLPTCQQFHNIYNMRARPYIPGIDQLVQVGSQT